MTDPNYPSQNRPEPTLGPNVMAQSPPVSYSWRRALTCALFLEVLVCSPAESIGQVRSCALNEEVRFGDLDGPAALGRVL